MSKIEKIQPSHIFTNYIYKAIPLAFDESMSYYETLCGVLDLLHTHTEVINNNAEVVEELESYVEHYFDNLDVQEEINDKLDEMASDGTLDEIINQEIFGQINSNITQINNDINAINGNLTTTNTNVSNLTTQVNNFGTTLGEFNSEIQSLSDDIASNTANIATQSARIDSLATLTEGSTTGDAELIDARTDAYSKTYSSLGNHIRGFEGALFESIVDDLESHTGQYINTSGNVQNLASFSRYCIFTKPDTLYYISCVAGDSIPQFILGTTYYPSQLPSGEHKEDKVIVGTGELLQINNKNINTSFFVGVIKTNSTQYTDITSQVTVTTGKYKPYRENNLATLGVYDCYEFIPKRNKTYLISTYTNDNIPFYDQIGGETVLAPAGKYSNSYIVTPNQNLGKIYVNFRKSIINTPKIYESNNCINTTYDNTNGLFDKIVCIGDSLMYGQTYTGSSQSYHNYYNIPHFLKKRINPETIKTYAHTGYTSTDAWTNYQNNITDTNSLYVVWLGTNDTLTDTVSTDCSGSDYTNYADTSTGNLGKILCKISNLSNNKIILINNFSTVGTLATNNKVINDLATKFNCMIVDIYNTEVKNAIYHTAYNNYYNGVHFNNLGHSFVANQIIETINNKYAYQQLELYKQAE